LTVDSLESIYSHPPTYNQLTYDQMKLGSKSPSKVYTTIKISLKVHSNYIENCAQKVLFITSLLGMTETLQISILLDL